MSVAVRLCEIPSAVRLAAVPRACSTEQDPGARQEILQAALFPSNRVYRVSDDARDLVERWRQAA